ncbi:MAG: hypothetical protein ABSG32_00950 [Terriglobia bacterium]
MDPTAVAQANQQLWANHPELGGRQLTDAPEDAAYRQEWMKLYHQALQGASQPPQQGSAQPPSPQAAPTPAPAQSTKWYEVDQEISGLETDIKHDINVQREAIPLVFVPGIMGSRLRLAGTNGTGDGSNGLPNLRWDPGDSGLLWKYSGATPSFRKRMLVGPQFSSSFLEVDNTNPVGDGFNGIFKDYRPFLTSLKTRNWGPLGKIFELPVFTVGYNWTDDNTNSGTMLAARISEIIKEAKAVTGICEKVILITHSMGGLVARWAREQAGASGSVLGIIHGVQPTTGAAAAYWRIKAGFEGAGPTSRILGNSGPTVTPILANIPGGLQLLPNKQYQTDAGSQQWLTVTENGQMKRSLPKSDPYDDIYSIKAVVQPAPGEKPSTNAYWTLVDPDLLDPDAPSAPSGPDAISAGNPPTDPWTQYLSLLGIAKTFHNTLGKTPQARTFCFRGIKQKTADAIELKIETNRVWSNPYRTRGFRGMFTDADGKSMQAVLQDPSGDGDGTVPSSSAGALNVPGKAPPGDSDFSVAHQPAYENSGVQAYTVLAIIALCKERYNECRGKK